MIDLNKFCASQYDGREYLRKPSRTPEGICASNGQILVCVPDDGRQCDDAKEALAKVVAKHKDCASESGRLWVNVAAIKMPSDVPCKHCDVDGNTFKTKCQDCDGDGDFWHGDHLYDCKNCGGSGTISSDESDGTKEECSVCGGTGIGFQVVKVGSTFLQQRFLKMLADLPNCRIGVLGELNSVAVIFDGGFGALMPTRE